MIKGINHSFSFEDATVPSISEYFEQIFLQTFQPEQLTKRTYIYANRNVNKDKTKADDVSKITGLNQLLRRFEVWGHTICRCTQPAVTYSLQKALPDHRIRLSNWSVIYTFESMRTYQYSFIAARSSTARTMLSRERQKVGDASTCSFASLPPPLPGSLLGIPSAFQPIPPLQKALRVIVANLLSAPAKVNACLLYILVILPHCRLAKSFSLTG